MRYYEIIYFTFVRSIQSVYIIPIIKKMIIDSTTFIHKYDKLHPHFNKVFEFIKSIDIYNPTIGKHLINGTDAYVIINDSSLRTQEEAKLEVHNAYIDIQLPISKAERFGWSSRNDLKNPTASFDDDRDIQYFEDKPSTYFDLYPGSFVIFFPDDAHAPCIGIESVIKVVAKIKI